MTAERPKFGPIRPKHPGIQTRTAPDLSSNPTFRSQYRRKIRYFEVSNLLKSSAQETYPDKDNNLLITGARFDPDKCPDTKRGNANIDFVSVLQLDFDDSDIPLEQLPALFGHTCWLAYNSYSNDFDKSSRFRVFMPLMYPVTAEVYVRLWDYLAERIEQFGYVVGDRINGRPYSGLDRSKRTPNSIFYLPCQAKKQPEKNSFFIDCGWDVEKMIDWKDFIRQLDFTERDEYTEVQFETQDPTLIALRQKLLEQQMKVDYQELEQKIELERLRATTAAAGKGNQAIKTFLVRMKHFGLSREDALREGTAVAKRMKHPEERVKDVPSYVRSIWR